MRQFAALRQQPDLLVAHHQGCEPFLGRGLEAAGRFARSEDTVAMSGSRDALERHLAQILIVEAAASQAAHLFAHHDAAWFGDALEPRGEIRRVAHDRLLLRRALSDEVADDHESGGDTDAD